MHEPNWLVNSKPNNTYQCEKKLSINMKRLQSNWNEYSWLNYISPFQVIIWSCVGTCSKSNIVLPLSHDVHWTHSLCFVVDFFFIFGYMRNETAFFFSSLFQVTSGKKRTFNYLLSFNYRFAFIYLITNCFVHYRWCTLYIFSIWTCIYSVWWIKRHL